MRAEYKPGVSSQINLFGAACAPKVIGIQYNREARRVGENAAACGTHRHEKASLCNLHRNGGIMKMSF